MDSVIVYTTYNDMEAEMIRNLLSEYEIPCQVISDIAHTVFPFTHDHKLSQVRILVDAEEAQRAEEIITEFLNSPEPLFTGQESDGELEDTPESG
ncbi:MAG TPA: DUF2007 domain-containing protein [bacterium]|nr:DUF2007 domain-containing protein [bacterium]